jgi:hypothetical protein
MNRIWKCEDVARIRPDGVPRQVLVSMVMHLRFPLEERTQDVEISDGRLFLLNYSVVLMRTYKRRSRHQIDYNSRAGDLNRNPGPLKK